jgi:hypothetical protein
VQTVNQSSAFPTSQASESKVPIRIRLKVLHAGLVFAVLGCAHFKAIDTANVKALAFDSPFNPLPICGLGTARLPPVKATMQDGSVRTTSELPKYKDSQFDGSELVWTVSAGTVKKGTFDRISPGATPGLPNRFVYEPPAELSQLVENDVTVTVAFKSNPSVKATMLLEPNFKCDAVVDFSGAPGVEGAGGHGGVHATETEPAGSGEDGSDGVQGQNGENIEAKLTVISSSKRGKLGYGLFRRADGKQFEIVFAMDGPGLKILANGGAGGRGGQTANGGDGSQAATGAQLRCGGNGGNSGNGGRGGNGGRAVIRIDRAHPELQQVVKGSADPGPGGDVYSPGQSGDNFFGCNRNGSDGRMGRRGSAGVAGSVSTSYENSEALFPGGPKLGSGVAVISPGEVLPFGAKATPATKASAPGTPSRGPTTSAPAPSAEAAPSTSLRLVNHTKITLCRLQAGTRQGNSVTFGPNLMGAKLGPAKKATISGVPGDTAILRAVSCDGNSAGLEIYHNDSSVSIEDYKGKELPPGVLSLGKTSDLANSPFEVK